jgi:hypothetical protein
MSTLSRVAVLAPIAAIVLAEAGDTTRVEAQRRVAAFAVAEIFVELNDTDGDLGLHALIDGDPWKSLKVEGPGGQELLSMVAEGRLQDQGLTELAFESAELPFDVLAPADFFRRFPEGDYDIEGQGQGGITLRSKARLSHVLAAPPDDITLSGVPAAEDCDADPLPEVPSPVVIRWTPVTTSHPDIGSSGPVRISRYQLFVEQGALKFSIDLPPDVTEFEVPAGVTDRGGQFKFEIIARTSAGNNTAVESCFVAR